MKVLRSGWIKAAAGIAIITAMIYFVDITKVAAALSSADPFLMALAFLLTPVSMALRFVRWDRIIRLSGNRLGMWQNARIYMIGFFFGTITPSKLGDLLKFRYLHKEHGITQGTALSLSVLDRIFDLIVIIAVGSTALFIAYSAGSFASVLIVALVFAASLFMMLNRRIFRKCSDFLVLKLSVLRRYIGVESKVDKEGAFESLYAPFGKLRQSPAELSSITALSFLIWLSVGLQAQLIFLAMGISLEFFALFPILCLATLVSLLPLTVSGLGTREAAMILLFSMLGVPANKTISMSLLLLLIGQISVAAIGGVMYALERKRQ